MDTLEALKTEVKLYHYRHTELRSAHHFDFAICHDAEIDYFFFGINPAETKQDKELFNRKGSYFNPYDPAKNSLDSGMWSQSAKRYRNFAKEICGSTRFLISEFFFWSTPNQPELSRKWGVDRFPHHWDFCRRMNERLFERFTPKAVIVVGMSLRHRVCVLKKDLKFVCHWSSNNSRAIKNGSRKLFEAYESSSGIPWVFVAHPASRLSREDKTRVADFIQSLTR